MSVGIRQAVERAIVTKIVADALAQGFSIEVDDGEDVQAVTSAEKKHIEEKCFATDDCLLYFEKEGKSVGWVLFVYGNDGWDCISDYTTDGATHNILTGGITLANAIEEGRFTIAA